MKKYILKRLLECQLRQACHQTKNIVANMALENAWQRTMVAKLSTAAAPKDAKN